MNDLMDYSSKLDHNPINARKRISKIKIPTTFAIRGFSSTKFSPNIERNICPNKVCLTQNKIKRFIQSPFYNNICL